MKLRKVHPQVSPSFIREWKEYIHNWQKTVDFIWLEPALSMNLFDDDGFQPMDFETFEKQPKNDPNEPIDPNWDEEFDPSHHSGGDAIQQMLLLADFEYERRKDMANEDEDAYRLANTWNIGLQAFEFMENTIGLDFNKIFERWNKTPPFLIPKHVSNKHGLTQKGSLFELLNEAIRAYIAGADASAVAMCRAILDMVLRDHYLPNGDDKSGNLYDVIKLATAKYDFLNENKLHILRTTANEILHDFSGSPTLSIESEKQLLSFFKDLKFYIEKAPIRNL